MKPNINEIWVNVLELIEEEVTPIAYTTWIKNARPSGIDDDFFYVTVDNEIVKANIENRFSNLIDNAIAQATGKKLSLAVINAEAKDEPDEKPSSQKLKYTFENFIVGNSNRFAHAACLAVAEEPANAYNPLFLYGGVGLGKTHLIQAIKNYIAQNNPRAKILYVSGEIFTNEFIRAVMNNRLENFRDKYRKIDVLLVDDVQFIAGKDRSEEEFFHTFNALHGSDKQIVLTSDRPPKEIKMVHDRLMSRFEWGLVCDIQLPDYETRMAILKNKAKNDHVVISDDVLSYIAENVKSNIRELEGIYNRVVAFKNLINDEITVETAQRVIMEFASDDSDKTITPDYIIDCCARFFGVRREDIVSKKRNSDIVFARQVVMYLCRELIDMSYPNIGKIFNNDHTTVMHSCKKVSEDMKRDISIDTNVRTLIKDIKGEL